VIRKTGIGDFTKKNGDVTNKNGDLTSFIILFWQRKDYLLKPPANSAG